MYKYFFHFWIKKVVSAFAVSRKVLTFAPANEKQRRLRRCSLNYCLRDKKKGNVVQERFEPSIYIVIDSVFRTWAASDDFREYFSIFAIMAYIYYFTMKSLILAQDER